jgi:hypothetical protein
MMKLSLTLGAAALTLCALTGIARAGDSFGDDDNDYSYRRQSLSRLCYQHPDDPRCDPYAGRYRAPRRSYSEGGACVATVRAAGKRNLFGAFARNSAIFSWQREVRSVHGSEYANWGEARNTSISCGSSGGALTGCVATARPCRS